MLVPTTLCTTNMPFNIAIPSNNDAVELANLHLAAMDANLLMDAQFPNDDARRFLHAWLCNDTKHHIANDSMGVFVARDVDTGKIASFVKWNVQRPNGADHGQQPDEDDHVPECCRREYLDSYAELTKKARRQLLGDRPHYRKSLTQILCICTLPREKRDRSA